MQGKLQLPVYLAEKEPEVTVDDGLCWKIQVWSLSLISLVCNSKLDLEFMKEKAKFHIGFTFRNQAHWRVRASVSLQTINSSLLRNGFHSEAQQCLFLVAKNKKSHFSLKGTATKNFVSDRTWKKSSAFWMQPGYTKILRTGCYCFLHFPQSWPPESAAGSLKMRPRPGLWSGRRGRWFGNLL